MSEPHTDRVRASDAEREQVAEELRKAMGEGRLTLTEGEERLAAMYATTYRDELAGFTADLPAPEPAGPAAGRGGGARGAWRHRRGPRPAIALALPAAVAAGIWAVAGGPLWPAILLGILTIVLIKRSAIGHHHHDGHPHRGDIHRGHHHHRCDRVEAA